MFPLKNTEAYIHANGFRSTLGKELADRDAEINELGSEIQALTNYVAENNVKNLLPVSLSALKSLNADGSWNGNVCTIGGMTFTVNDDLSITLNETSTATVTFTLYNGTNPTDYNGKILSGFTGGSGGTGIRISDTIATSVYNYSDDTLITGLTATNQVAVIIRIDSGKTFNNQLVTPMIRDASIADGSYQPYAKTNVELTQDVAIENISNSFYDSLETGISVLDAAVYKQGKHIFGSFVVQSTDAFEVSSATAIMTLKYAPIVSINTFFALGNAQWGSVQTLGYMYVNRASKSMTLEVRDADKHFAKIMIDYATA